ncbi:MAG TPA: exopolysaccharide biosynthesis protein [Sphingomicrobium sp.]|nr:exopolysaccharide biosynthesis protein [Sphingomicrobium sp.]
MTKDSPAAQGRPLSLSKRLAQIIAEEGPDRLSFSELATRLHSRAWGGLLFIFAAINVLPLPPGTSSFFALPLLIVSAQLVFGRTTPWFPARLDRRGVTKQELKKLVDKMQWLEMRVERLFKPRIAALTGPTAARVIGLVCFLLALAAAIPIPLFHMAPAAAILLFGVALIYRDGALVIAAVLATIGAIVVDALIIGSGVVALSYAASWFRQ